jgi:acylpyruvate hydrolase
LPGAGWPDYRAEEPTSPHQSEELMRLVTIRAGGATRAARMEGDRLHLLDAADVGEVLARGIDSVPASGSERALEPRDLAPLVPRPRKIICLGLNYQSHITEMGRDLPSYPTLFAKYDRSLIGAQDPIVLPAASHAMDWEAELAFVVGRPARHADPQAAAAAIAGYTIMNDISARDWQWRTKQWLQGKTFERTTPLGPALVTPDEVDDARDLAIRCEVDGEVMQESRTADLLFKPADIVAYLSTILTLEPGDVIATGTPSGVGAMRDPKQFLQPGQTVRTTVEGLGELLNVCVAEEEAP